MTRRALRNELRARRRALTPADRTESVLAFTRHLLGSPLFRTVRRIGAYVAADGEMDPGPFIAAARLLGREIHLPVLDPLRGGGMRFVRTEADQSLYPNRYGIPEPHSGRVCPPQFLDLVLVPLVGFDSDGNRLGMGAGYYDRCFAYLGRRHHWRKPRLVGVGFAFQEVGSIEAGAWDVPLDAIVTDNGVLIVRG